MSTETRTGKTGAEGIARGTTLAAARGRDLADHPTSVVAVTTLRASSRHPRRPGPGPATNVVPKEMALTIINGQFKRHDRRARTARRSNQKAVGIDRAAIANERICVVREES